MSRTSSSTRATLEIDLSGFLTALACGRSSGSKPSLRGRAGEQCLQDCGRLCLDVVTHARNLDREIRSVQASLDYYVQHFGPYPQGQIRLVEHPGNGNTLHSSPINISYQEGFSLFNPREGPEALDFPFAVVAHEVAHQWWGNQVTPAPVEGAPLLTESLAWYSAMAVVEKTYGPEHLHRLLKVMRKAYLTPHARAGV